MVNSNKYNYFSNNNYYSNSINSDQELIEILEGDVNATDTDNNDEVDEELTPPTQLLTSATTTKTGSTNTATSSRVDVSIVSLQVFHVAIDMLTYILLALFFYITSSLIDYNTITDRSSDSSSSDSSSSSSNTSSIVVQTSSVVYNHIQQILLYSISHIAAPTFPVILFLYILYKLIIPFSCTIRRNIWIVIYTTIMAPWITVSFCDGLIGDIFTSIVQPVQDIVFTISYLLFGIQEWWSDYQFHDFQIGTNQTITISNLLSSSTATATATAYTTTTNVPMLIEQSWLLHTILLPACMISPLWWRFLQTLHKIYDTRQQLPIIGNTFKYFFASQIILSNVYQPTYYTSSSILFIIFFVLSTLYQIYWDIVWDWNLIVVVNQNQNQQQEQLQHGTKLKIKTTLFPYTCTL
jgi:EXS family